MALLEMLTPSPPPPRPSYQPGTRPLRQIFVLTLMIVGIMFIGAAAIYGVTVGLLALEPIVKSWIAANIAKLPDLAAAFEKLAEQAINPICT